MIPPFYSLTSPTKENIKIDYILNTILNSEGTLYHERDYGRKLIFIMKGSCQSCEKTRAGMSVSVF